MINSIAVVLSLFLLFGCVQSKREDPAHIEREIRKVFGVDLGTFASEARGYIATSGGGRDVRYRAKIPKESIRAFRGHLKDFGQGVKVRRHWEHEKRLPSWWDAHEFPEGELYLVPSKNTTNLGEMILTLSELPGGDGVLHLVTSWRAD